MNKNKKNIILGLTLISSLSLSANEQPAELRGVLGELQSRAEQNEFPVIDGKEPAAKWALGGIIVGGLLGAACTRKSNNSKAVSLLGAIVGAASGFTFGYKRNHHNDNKKIASTLETLNNEYTQKVIDALTENPSDDIEAFDPEIEGALTSIVLNHYDSLSMIQANTNLIEKNLITPLSELAQLMSNPQNEVSEPEKEAINHILNRITTKKEFAEEIDPTHISTILSVQVKKLEKEKAATEEALATTQTRAAQAEDKASEAVKQLATSYNNAVELEKAQAAVEASRFRIVELEGNIALLNDKLVECETELTAVQNINERTQATTKEQSETIARLSSERAALLVQLNASSDEQHRLRMKIAEQA